MELSEQIFSNIYTRFAAKFYVHKNVILQTVSKRFDFNVERGTQTYAHCQHVNVVLFDI